MKLDQNWNVNLSSHIILAHIKIIDVHSSQCQILNTLRLASEGNVFSQTGNLFRANNICIHTTHFIALFSIFKLDLCILLSFSCTFSMQDFFSPILSLNDFLSQRTGWQKVQPMSCFIPLPPMALFQITAKSCGEVAILGKDCCREEKKSPPFNRIYDNSLQTTHHGQLAMANLLQDNLLWDKN